MSDAPPSWVRLEPRELDDEVEHGLLACVEDPAWFLARQYQLNEFDGDDGGSAIAVEIKGDIGYLTDWRVGSEVAPIPTGRPLEPMVERVPGAAGLSSWQKRAESGRRFLKLLDLHGARQAQSAFLAAFPFDGPEVDQRVNLNADSQRWLRVMTGRIIDGTKLADALEKILPASPAQIAAAFAIPENIAPQVHDVITGWMSQLAAEAEQAKQPAAWNSERLEHNFDIAARLPNTPVVLRGEEHPGGAIDWWSFDRDRHPLKMADASPSELSISALPSPVSFHGMPSPRWWEFEDEAVNFGDVTSDRTDLAQLVALEFAVMYANDQFIVPIELPVGSVCQLNSVIVTDNFGGRYTIKPASSIPVHGNACRLFCQTWSDGSGSSDLVVLPPSLAMTPPARAVEEIAFLIDEEANLAWGVEYRVEGLSVESIDRHEAWLMRLERETNSDETESVAGLQYKLATEIADHWIPFQRQDATHYERQQMSDAPPAAALPWGELLEPGLAKYRVRVDEVPVEGLRLQRRWTGAFGFDGLYRVWARREKSVGRGPGSSGLAFDQVQLNGALKEPAASSG